MIITQYDVLTQNTNSPYDSSVYQGEKEIAWSRECESSVEVNMYLQEFVNKNKHQTIVLVVFITQIIVLLHPDVYSHGIARFDFLVLSVLVLPVIHYKHRK